MTATSPGAVLVLGGARSGKSAFAERLVVETGLSRHYIATGRAFDDEMRDRIARHRDDRGDGWETHEEPLALAETIAAVARPDRAVLVDCLTLWVSNLLLADANIARAGQQLCDAIGRFEGTLILVANEVGLGIVPDNALARAFRDAAGQLNQSVAATAAEVVLVTAGLPLTLKPRH